MLVLVGWCVIGLQVAGWGIVPPPPEPEPPPAETVPPVLEPKLAEPVVIVGTIGEALRKPDYPDTPAIALVGKVVIADHEDVGPDLFYIEEDDRSAGIRVNSSETVSRGNKVTVTGTLGVTAGGERCIEATNVAIEPQNALVPDPLAMDNPTVGGATLDPEGYSPGITGAKGPYNKGLLIMSWGRVTEADGNYYICDGSKVGDYQSADDPIRVVAPASITLAVGDYVVVTGISSSYVNGSDILKLVRIRDNRHNDDLKVIETGEEVSCPANTLEPNSWSLIGLPRIPIDASPESVFANTMDYLPDGTNHPSRLNGNLWRWETSLPSDNDPSPYVTFPETTIESQDYYLATIYSGEGYYIKTSGAPGSENPGAINYVGIGDPISTTDRYVSLPGRADSTAWTLTGYTNRSESLNYENLCVTDGSTTLSATDAWKANWITSCAYWWDTSTWSLCDVGLYEDLASNWDLEPWHGYFIGSWKDNLGLIIPAPPPPPQGLGAQQGNARVLLSWQPRWHCTYRVYRSQTTGGPYDLIGSARSTAYLDVGLENGTTYYYVVKSYRSELEGPKSVEVACTPTDGTAWVPWVPQGGSEVFGPNGTDAPAIGLTWEIIRSGNRIAGSDASNGWMVVFSSAEKFTVAAPEDAEVAMSYQVRYDRGSSQYVSAIFDVVPGGDNPKVPQGGSATFSAEFRRDQPAIGLTWDVVRNGVTIATDLNPSGWTVTYNQWESFTVAAPTAATVANFYKVRYRDTVGGENAYAFFDVVPGSSAGTPLEDIPAPAWAESAMPTDSCAAGGFGPSAADSVNLASGVGDNRPGPDIVVDNPIGPDAVFERLYRSALAENGYASPGLSAGWAHNFDVHVQGPAGSWGDLTLTYPNQAGETLIPELVAGNPTGTFLPTGAPYVVDGQASVSPGQWDWIRITFRDGSKWVFTAPDPSNPHVCLLSKITNLTDNYISVNRISATDHRVQNITDQSSGTLLSFGYNVGTGYLSTITDVAGRQITYTFGPAAGTTCLTAVSRINTPGASNWAYDYTSIGGQPFLTWVEVPDPMQEGADTGKMRGHSINYDTNGHVSSLVDANGNQRVFIYNGNRTIVHVRDQNGALVQGWIQKIGDQDVDTGMIDANNNSASIEYANYRATGISNKNNQTIVMQYDADLGYGDYGRLRTVTDPRGLVTTFDYDSNFPLKVKSVQTGSKTATEYRYDANGLLEEILTPKPGTSGTSETVSTTLTYTAFGNVATTVAPGSNDTGTSITTVYDYTSDPDYGISGVPEAFDRPLRVTAYEGEPVENKVLRKIHYRYNSRGNVITIISASGNETTFDYDSANQVTRITYPPTGDTGPGSAHTDFIYLRPGGPLQKVRYYDESDALVVHDVMTKSKEEELVGQHGSMQMAGCTYDGLYRARTVTDGNNHTAKFDYDSVGNLLGVTHPLGDMLKLAYDADGNLTLRTDPASRITTYVRDPVDSRLTDIIRPDNSHTHYDYDDYGRVAAMTDYDPFDTFKDSLEYEYDDNDTLTSVTTTYAGLLPQTVSYTLYPDGSRETMATPIGTFQYYASYDIEDYPVPRHKLSVRCPWHLGFWTDCYYDWDSRIRRQNTFATQTTYSYNARSFLRNLRNYSNFPGDLYLTVMSKYNNVKYDSLGNLLEATVDVPVVGAAGPVSGMIYYTYENASRRRLVHEQRTLTGEPDLYDNPFAQDFADNLTTIRDQSYTYNANDRITSTGFGYDANGNTLTAGRFTFAYNTEDRPTQVIGGKYSPLYMDYRGDGMRAWKETAQWGRTYLIYDGDKVVCELDSSGNVLCAYGYGPNGLASRYMPGDSPQVRYYTYDPHGSLVMRTRHYDMWDDLVASDIAVYDGYGALYSDISTRSGEEFGSLDPVGFRGQWGEYTDTETRPDGDPRALALLGRDTYYDPETGRFIARGSAGVNPYQAVLNTMQEHALQAVMDFDPEQSMDSLQAKLDLVGFAPFIGEAADLANVGLYLGRGKWGLAACSAISLVPVAGDILGKGLKAVKHGGPVAKLATKRAGKYAVYVGRVANGDYVYTGITNRAPKIRLRSHVSKGKKLQKLDTTVTVSSEWEARNVEQALLNTGKFFRKHPYANRINSISPKCPDYLQRVIEGANRLIGTPWEHLLY